MNNPRFLRNRKTIGSSQQPLGDYGVYSSLGRNIKQTGGVNISGDVINIGGDVVGRDKITTLSADELSSIYKTAKIALDRGDIEKAIDNLTEISESFPGYRDTEKLLSRVEKIESREKQIRFWLIVYGCLIGGLALAVLAYAYTETGVISFLAAIIGIIGGGACSYAFLRWGFPKTMLNFWIRFGILTPTCLIGGLAGLLVVAILLFIGLIWVLSQAK